MMVMAVVAMAPTGALGAPPQIQLTAFPLVGPNAVPGQPIAICGCTTIRITWMVDAVANDRATSASLNFYGTDPWWGFTPGPGSGPLSLAPPTMFGFGSYYEIRDVTICNSQQIVLTATNTRGETMRESIMVEVDPTGDACPVIQAFQVQRRNVCGCKDVPITWSTDAARVELHFISGRTSTETLIGAFAGSGGHTARICESGQVRLTAVADDGARIFDTRSVENVRNVRLPVIPGPMIVDGKRACGWRTVTAEPAAYRQYSPDMRIVRVDNVGRPIRLTRAGVSATLDAGSSSTNAFNGMTANGSWLADAVFCESDDPPSFTVTAGCP